MEILTDYPERILQHRYLHLARPTTPDDVVSYPVEAVRPHKGVLLIKLGGCDDRDAAEGLRGMLAQIPFEEAERVIAVLEAAGNEDATAVVIPELNHLLRYHPEEPNLVYRHVGAPLDPRVAEAVNGWILERFGH